MSRGAWLIGGAALGLGAIAVATRAARAASVARPGRELVGGGRELAGEGGGRLASSAGTAGAVVVAPERVTSSARLLPLLRAKYGPTGAFRAVRQKGQGQCRSGYPCVHLGVDLVPPSFYRGPLVEEEFWVRAPEDLVVDLVVFDNATPPLSGYGPGAVLAQGRSGTWHVFGHLSPRTLRAIKKGDTIAVGHFFARLASGLRPPHVHWEPRRWRTEGPASRELGRKATRSDIVIDPDLWLRGAA